MHKDGRPNGSDGVSISGQGTVINHAGALIYSVGGAVPIHLGTVINEGTIKGDVIGVIFDAGSGTLVNSGILTGGQIGVLASAFNDTITNSGTISSPLTAISMGAGDDQLTLLPGSVLEGTVDGGPGTDTITLGGPGSGSFAGATNFEKLDVASGDWTLSAASTFTDGTAIQSGASLTGSSDVLTGAIDDAGTLVVNQAADGAFGAVLTGAGDFIKQGAGTLTIGDQNFTGPTQIAAGTLLLAGTLPSAVTVGNGGALAGTGRIASLTAESGGQLSLGQNATGTLNVSGDLVQQAGSTLLVTLGADRTAPVLVVDGKATIANGATLSLGPDTAAATIGSHYTLLTAAGGIAGGYAFAALPGSDLELRLTQGPDAVVGLVARQGSSLSAVATSASGAAVAPALAARGLTSQAYNDLTLDPSDAHVASALAALSGDFHPSVQTAMIEDALRF